MVTDEFSVKHPYPSGGAAKDSRSALSVLDARHSMPVYRIPLTSARSPDCPSTEDLARALVTVRNLPESPLAPILRGNTSPSGVAAALRAAHVEGAPVLELLQLSATRTLSLSLGSATIRQYLSGLRNYITYVRCLSDISGDTIPVFPIDPMVIVSWVSTFRNGRTAENYVCHLRKWALLLGEDPSGLNSALVSTALRGQIREHPGGTRRMKAIQLALLRQLIPGTPPLQHNGGSPRADPEFSAFVLAYWFLFRIPSELLSLPTAAITVNADKSVVVRLSKRKNINRPVTLIRFCVCSSIGAQLCPHTHARALISQGRQDSLLLPKTSAQRLRKSLRQRLAGLGRSDSEQFGLHSFRRGHATDLSEQDVAPSVLLRMGGWRSAAFQVYLNLPDVHARAASKLVIDESSDEE